MKNPTFRITLLAITLFLVIAALSLVVVSFIPVKYLTC